MVADPQEGHFFGKLNFFEFLFLFFKSTEITRGITSPALSTVTTSPTLISFLSISSSLCKVAFDTKTPPIFTGLIFATGVSAPVLPTCISIFWISDIDLLAENLWAIAHLGALATKPNLFWRLKSFTLYTIPSISKSISFLFSSISEWFWIKLFIPIKSLFKLFTLNPQFFR